MPDPIVHVEMWSKDPSRTADFYRKAFGWEVQHLPEMRYWMSETGEGGVSCGFVRPAGGDVGASATCTYIRVVDLEQAIERVRSAGGRLIMERTEVPDVGSFALFEDLDGRVMGVWQ